MYGPISTRHCLASTSSANTCSTSPPSSKLYAMLFISALLNPHRKVFFNLSRGIFSGEQIAFCHPLLTSEVGHPASLVNIDKHRTLDLQLRRCAC
ncbi:hypothetical protein ACTXT7_016748 [Hymenolepis weldensis]